MPLLKAENLGFAFGSTRLFRGLSFELRRGEFMCVLGPNGSGKSTLLRLLTGYQPPQEGKITIKGRSPWELGPAGLAKLAAYVPSEPLTPYDFTVRETVLLGRLARTGFWRGYSAEDEAAAARAMDETGIAALSARSVNTLSTGERQLVFIAQALTQGAALLLLDEPTSHLDLRYKALVMGLLARLAARGLAVIIVLHEPSLARLGCGRALLLRGGGEHSLAGIKDALLPENLASVYGLPADSPLLRAAL